MSAGGSLRVAVVGVGTMGLDHARRIEHDMARATVTAIVEPDAARASAAAEMVGGATTHATIEDALSAGGFDACVIATPAAFHEPALHAVLDAGMPTLCEKPLTIGSESARRVVDHELTLPHRLLQVGFHRRFDAGYRRLRSAIGDRELGGLLLLHCRHRNPALPPGWTQELLIEDACAHEMDIATWLTGEPLVSVEVRSGRGNPTTPRGIQDPLMVLLRTADDVLVDVEINMSFGAAYQVLSEAVFERGAIAVGDTPLATTVSDGRRGTAEHMSYVSRFATAYDTEVQAWIDAVLEGSDPLGATAWDGYRTSLAAEAGVESMRTGRTVGLALEPVPQLYAASHR